MMKNISNGGIIQFKKRHPIQSFNMNYDVGMEGNVIARKGDENEEAIGWKLSFFINK
jgi:hypothetical protein